MTPRIEKVNSLLEHEISKILVRDFGFQGALVTLTHVNTSANLIETKAYISVLPEERTDAIITVLNKGVYDVQQKINKMVNMRPVPKISFVRDKETLEASKIEAILEKIKEEESN
ncbi:MAG: 30S ribosome-binding factor RbfA [Candidatus Staskawiczbacteria bacterium]|nr:30S ribosome-binding factor RbfA [Candidatus Staskawiczbacteria bacterium]